MAKTSQKAEINQIDSHDTEQHSYEFNTNLKSLESLYWDTYYYDVDIDSVKLWLKDPIEYNKQLRDLSRRLYGEDGVYTNAIDYMVAMPTLDKVIYCTSKPTEQQKKRKQQFLNAVNMFKDKIVARDILLKLALEGVSFAYFEIAQNDSLSNMSFSDTDIDKIIELNETMNCSVIPLPTDYCRIVGIKNSSYQMAFNMSYFDQFISNGLSLKLKKYPKEIRDKYKEYNKNKSKKWFVLDNTKTIVNKIRAKREERWGRPIGLAAFVDIMYDSYFVDTKRTVLDEINSTVVYQTFPEGETKGTCSLTNTQQKEQHDNIKNALFTKGKRKGINFFSVAAGTKLDKIKTDVDILKTDMESKILQRICTDLGFAGSLLNGESGNYSSQQTNLQLLSAQIFSWLEQIQDELNKVINENIIKDRNNYIQLYYLPTTYVNQKDKIQNFKDLYLQGKGSLNCWIASTGVNPEAYISLMDYEKEEGYDEKYLPHLTSFTMSDSLDKLNPNKDIGRPQTDDTTNENTIRDKSNGSKANIYNN